MKTSNNTRPHWPAHSLQAIIFVCVGVISFLTTTVAFAKDYSFAWSANPEPVEGYKLYYKVGGDPIPPFDGTGATQGSSPIDVGKVTTFTITGLDENTTYHFALTAYNGSEESGFSEIVSVPEPTTSTPPVTSTPLNAVIVTASQTGETPFNLTFDGSQSTGSISSYAWSFGDGQTATGATVTHVYQSEGSYTATLTIADTDGLTQQSSVVITVIAPATTPPPTQSAPIPVISSSATIGEAPLSVNFDGSGSSSAQSPIMSYIWAFGDGATAEGALVSHTFATAGTYHTSLTVTDSAGLSAQISTPVLVSAPTVIENELPVASLTASPISGNAPLNVTFSGSGSTDADGTISSYIWSFGDGSTANGLTAQHIFTEAGDYTVALEVVDDKGDSSVKTQVVSVQAPEAIKLELQEIQADTTWKKVVFSQPFIDPVIVAGPMGYVDSAAATVRVRNVTPTDCEIRLEEWYDIRSPHSLETFSILIVEKGVYSLENGLKLEAGTFSGTATFQNLAYQQAYSKKPVVVTQIMTTNEATVVSGRLQNATTTSIEYKMQEREKNRANHKPETVGYIAWEPGIGEYSGMKFEAQHTPQNNTNYWSDLAFQTQFDSKPYFFAEMQTYAEADTATVRTLNLSLSTVRMKIEEEQSKDVETNHAAEAVGYIAITPL